MLVNVPFIIGKVHLLVRRARISNIERGLTLVLRIGGYKLHHTSVAAPHRHDPLGHRSRDRRHIVPDQVCVPSLAVMDDGGVRITLASR